MHEPHLRAADSDRQAVATTLGRAMSEGRLTVSEYEDRLARAYAARTFGELAELTADLPSAARPPAARQVPPPAARPAPWPAAAHCGGHRGGHRSSYAAWLSTAIIVLGIWTVTSVMTAGPIHFWPAWVIGPWGAVLLARRLGASARHSGGAS
ncbi:DUF1707 domain-containing protein [Blastococcus sp. TF02-8]|uniref:DUF1707 SHOCT-like domain-containing protein n=1 Tax=Blastococcus sp. TF02-8 TaxID=2250574 RepID=UPI000DE92E2F|nr:DUF1707 domain-containing protein [Blastococcus sp. TF02-8]RBY93628.1 DUF1707 domain-containing protein [Blastococcus sp. TF02-8]